MSWFNSKSSANAKPRPETKAHRPAHHLHLDAAMERRIAEFLIEHGRLVARNGRPLIQLLGSAKHHDGSIDYSIRTRVKEANGAERRYDSHIRHLPNDQLKLIR